MSRYYGGEDQAIREALITALRPFGIESEDGCGSDFHSRDISFTLPANAPAAQVLRTAEAVMTNYDGTATISV